MILETHALSPFVEKVRWCLDYTGVPYEEEMVLKLYRKKNLKWV